MFCKKEFVVNGNSDKLNFVHAFYMFFFSTINVIFSLFIDDPRVMICFFSGIGYHNIDFKSV